MTVESIYRTAEKTVESQDRFRASDGFQLFYRRWSLGGETERIVLGLHGAGLHSGQFEQMGGQLPADVPGTELYAVDRRGFGNSVEDGFQRGGVSNFNRSLQDVDEFAESLRKNHPGKKFFLFGHSMGCVQSLRFASNHPDSVDGLILAAPPAVIKLEIARGLLLRVMFLRMFSPGTMVDTMKYRSEATRKGEEAESVIRNPLSSHGNYSVRYLFGLSRFIRTTLPTARGVRAPTLILQGGKDGLVEPTGVAKLLEAMPATDKSVKNFPGADHHFYDGLLPRADSKYDDATRRQVYDAIEGWLRTH